MDHSWIELDVVSRETVATDIVALVMASPDGQDLPAFSAGSHIDVEIKPGLIRQYSLCNNPQDRDRYEIAVLKDPASRGGSVALHETIAQGSRVRISEPRNHFALEPSKAKALLLGGGIGVTPLMCMAERLAALDAPFELHYCTRSPDRTAYRDRILASSYASHVHFHFDDGDKSQLLDAPALFAAADKNSHIYVCGPGGFIDWVLGAADKAGFPQAQVHREYFNVVAAPPVEGGERAFEIQIASSGLVLQVPADKSVAQVLEENNLPLAISCEQGVCGTCITRLIAGDPDHRDMLGLDGAQEFTPCCSRSFSDRLVLDL
jgi:vanillate O-demethylase ferredoxin subunit